MSEEDQVGVCRFAEEWGTVRETIDLLPRRSPARRGVSTHEECAKVHRSSRKVDQIARVQKAEDLHRWISDGAAICFRRRVRILIDTHLYQDIQRHLGHVRQATTFPAYFATLRSSSLHLPRVSRATSVCLNLSPSIRRLAILSWRHFPD